MGTTATVGSGNYAGNTNAAIQRAVDDVASGGGGEVIVPAGDYAMHDALHLRSNVRVVGQAGAVLKKVPSISSRIVDFLGYGHYEFTVAEPDRFRVGMGVHLLDDNAGGFYTTVATITARDGERFFIDRPLNHDYLPRADARAVSAFSLVEGVGVRDASVEGLTLDGGLPEETFKLNGCRGGGVFLLGSQRVRVRGVEVVNYHGDGISFQQCADIVVADCRVHRVSGHGLHPGSGSVRYVMRRVRSHDNGRCGVYYCLRTTHSILADCRLHDNGEAGVSIGERDTDHLVCGNRIRGNGRSGVLFRRPQRRGGDRVILRDNAIGPNCAREGRFELTIPAGLSDVLVEGNRFAPTGEPAGPVAQVEAGCAGIHFVTNTVGGAALGPEHVEAPDGAVRFDPPESPPAVGPDALPADGARHLNLVDLGPWGAWGGPVDAE